MKSVFKLETYVVFVVLTLPIFSRASISLLQKEAWAIDFSGVVELDMFHDSARSFTENIGNAPVDRPGTYSGDRGRTQFSMRNSRFAFSILPPLQNDWTTKAYFEFDFLGYEATPPAIAESNFFSSPTLRVRHANFSAQKDGWSFLAGQSWSLFGWQPYYVLSTASVSPAPGSLYQRTAEVMALKTLELNSGTELQVGFAVARPSQRDAEIPNLDLGARATWSGRKSGLAAANGGVSIQPLSVGLSGTLRQFTTPKSTTDTTQTTQTQGTAVAADVLIPVISTDEKSPAGTLTFTGEFSSGSGDADGFPGWTGNLSTLPSGSGLANLTNLDAGQGGFDNNGSFTLVQLQSWNAQLQYYFPTESVLFVTIGYGELTASGVSGLTPITAGRFIYDKTSIYFANLFRDLTEQIRVGAEYSQISTRYVDAVTASDRRVQLSGYFRF